VCVVFEAVGEPGSHRGNSVSCGKPGRITGPKGRSRTSTGHQALAFLFTPPTR